MSESAIQAKIMDALKASGTAFWRINNTGKLPGGRWASRSSVGVSDLIAIGPGGVFTGIEVKDADGEQNDAQIKFQEAVERAGGVYIVARSVDDVLALLRSWGRVV